MHKTKEGVADYRYDFGYSVPTALAVKCTCSLPHFEDTYKGHIICSKCGLLIDEDEKYIEPRQRKSMEFAI